MILGGIGIWLGIWGLFMVIAPPQVKLLVIAGGVYALAIVGAMVWRDRRKSHAPTESGASDDNRG